MELYKHQIDAVEKLKSGSILCGGVGSGKSRTSIVYFFVKECGGSLEINGDGEYKEMSDPKDLYIITTAKKRDSMEWDKECAPFIIFRNRENSVNGVELHVDSWNNIAKYSDVSDAFFIFDEQRVVGYGAWVKAFLKIAKNNHWILLSATPGDTWSDYIPVFIANGFFKNKTQFNREHVIWSRYAKYPKIDRYINCGKLLRMRNSILVEMKYSKPTISHHEIVDVDYDSKTYKEAVRNRWDVFKEEPVRDAAGLCYLLRRITNSSGDRKEKLKAILEDHSKVIIFYNFDYELEILRSIGDELGIPTSEWNGHKHQSIPDTDSWLYLCQYTSACEGWNCIDTDTIIFFSQSYSYKVMVQAAGRIDRMNTPFTDLYYYHLKSYSPIDVAIRRALDRKKNFNEAAFVNRT